MVRIRRQLVPKVLGGIVGTAGIGGGLLYWYEDEGTRRAMKAYSTFVPVVLHYRWVEARHKYLATAKSSLSSLLSSEESTPNILLKKKELDQQEKEEEWKALDDLYADRTVERLGELQGMYCKYGQTAAGFTNTLGEAWIRALRTLENEVPPRPVEVVHQTILEETGKPYDETFVSIDPKPLGSASIGQVHRGTLMKDGKLIEVAIKIQYPEAQKLFSDDIHAIRAFCEAFAPEHVVMLNAMEQSNRGELDYTQEAKNLEEIRANLEKDGFAPGQVVVPRPFPELSTKRMLVMELLPGEKLIDGMRKFYAEWAEANGTTLEALENEARSRIEKEGIPAKYDGPSGWQIAIYSRYLKIRDSFVNVGIAAYNSVAGKALGASTISYQKSSIPPNTPRIIDTLMRVHGYQLLQDGVFNSDPHGGNFLLLPDGRIGLIDYGATKRLIRNERLSMCLLYAAIHRRDEEKLFQLCDIGGYKSKYGRRDILMKLILFGYDSWGKDVTEGKNIQQFIDDMKAEDPWEEVPDNFVMAQFMSTRLRSLALGMNSPIKCSEWWGPIAEEVLIKEGHPYESWDLEKMKKYQPELNMQRYKFA
ncbi:unnamed protein product [Cylindrotheca closterium]|uniref:ABC1 atypical kinase-like domain-containing protein n=1 Tax=Cylindrotheca closterium TaxID=2856 RepID=A0AAD2JMV4_9STRA|nr:unnamed protein product [Cylindrotheca closterium]